MHPELRVARLSPPALGVRLHLSALLLAVLLALCAADAQAYQSGASAQGGDSRPTRVYRDDNGQLYYVDDQGALHTITRRGAVTTYPGGEVYYLKGDDRPHYLDDQGRLYYRDPQGNMHFIEDSGPGRPIDPLPLLKDSKVYPALQSGKSPSYCASEWKKCAEQCKSLRSGERKACMRDCADAKEECKRMY